MSNSIGAAGFVELSGAFVLVTLALLTLRTFYDRMGSVAKARTSSTGEFHVQILVAMYGLLLGFVTVALWQKQDDAERNSVDESNQVRLLSRAGVDMGGDRQAMTDALIAYTQAVVYKEWPMMLQGRQEELFAASPELDAIWVQIVAARPETPAQTAIYDQVVEHYETLTLDRQLRLLDSERELPDILGFTLVAGAVVLLLTLLLMRTNDGEPHRILSAVTSGYLVLLLYLVVVLEHPFQGLWRVTYDPYLKVLSSLH